MLVLEIITYLIKVLMTQYLAMENVAISTEIMHPSLL